MSKFTKEYFSKEYYLKQNIQLAVPYLMEALGYTSKYGISGGMFYYKNGKHVIPNDFPTKNELDAYVKNLTDGLSVEEAKQEFVATRDKLK